MPTSHVALVTHGHTLNTTMHNSEVHLDSSSELIELVVATADHYRTDSIGESESQEVDRPLIVVIAKYQGHDDA